MARLPGGEDGRRSDAPQAGLLVAASPCSALNEHSGTPSFDEHANVTAKRSRAGANYARQEPCTNTIPPDVGDALRPLAERVIERRARLSAHRT